MVERHWTLELRGWHVDSLLLVREQLDPQKKRNFDWFLKLQRSTLPGTTSSWDMVRSLGRQMPRWAKLLQLWENCNIEQQSLAALQCSGYEQKKFSGCWFLLPDFTSATEGGKTLQRIWHLAPKFSQQSFWWFATASECLVWAQNGSDEKSSNLRNGIFAWCWCDLKRFEDWLQWSVSS